MKLRSTCRFIDKHALNADGSIKPFGGVNILCSGDFWQLPPPDGGFLGDIPQEYIENSRKFLPGPCISHGQSLVWSGPTTGIQGVTELEVCERTRDEWLRCVQNEFRIGQLHFETHAFYMACQLCVLVATLKGRYYADIHLAFAEMRWLMLQVKQV